MAHWRHTFQNSPELQRFVLDGVRPTGTLLGVGSYGSVMEVEVNGLVCAGKRLHEALLDQANAGVADIARKYFLECQVMAEMRHPHVVQFLGLCYLEGSPLPVLVMEKLDSSLDHLLETSPNLTLGLKLSLLTDVARGLVYLHTRNPPVVHRDLSARNVLLTSAMVAKISDLGNARIVSLLPGQLARTLTCIPGTQVYMPPESFDEGSRYGPRLDIFSFGHLALYTLTQVFPGALRPHTYPDPDNPSRVLGHSEVERRTDYIQPLREQLGEEHPLLELICQCLHNIAAYRPSAEELLQRLGEAKPQIEGPFGKQEVKVKMKDLQVGMMDMLEAKDNVIEQLQHDLQQAQGNRERLEAEVEAKNTQLQRKNGQIQQRDAELQERAAQINRQQRELQTLREDRLRLQAEVEAKDAEMGRQRGELQSLIDRELQRMRAETDVRFAEVRQQLTERDAEVRDLRVQMNARDDEINRLRKALGKEPRGEEPKLRLKWEQLANMPETMMCPRSVLVDGAVYVTAGNGSHDIHKYDLETQQWMTLPRYQYSDFSMGNINNQLTCVGGGDESTKKISNAIVAYSTSQRRWEQPYPPMKMPRRYPAVFAYHQHLVVAGGRDASGNLDIVEVLNTSTHQWFTTAPLPDTGSRMSYTIIKGTVYLLGGKMGKKVFSVSLPALTQTDKPASEWLTLAPVPLKYSTAVAVRGNLLAVGGKSGEKERSSAIHMYDQDKKVWNKVEDLPTEREDCTCCLLPSGKILTAGGEDKDGRTSRVDVATVLDFCPVCSQSLM